MAWQKEKIDYLLVLEENVETVVLWSIQAQTVGDCAW
jgi:hypothetical protein